MRRVTEPRLPSWAGLKARPTVLQQELLLRRVSANSAKARTLTHSLTLSAASRLPSSKNCRSRSFTLSDYPTNTCVGDQTEMPRLDKWGWPLRSVYPQTGILTVPSMPDVLRPYPRLGWTFRRGLLPAGSAYAVRTRTDQDQRTKVVERVGLEPTDLRGGHRQKPRVRSRPSPCAASDASSTLYR